MHKKKVSYNILPQVATPVSRKILNGLSKALTVEVASIFDLEEQPLKASLERVVMTNHITLETRIAPMQTKISDLLTLVNEQAVVKIEEHEVIIKGIDIGNHSIALITALPGGAFSGTVAVSYVNLFGERLQPFTPSSDKRKLAERQQANHTLKGLETMLTVVANYQATFQVEEKSE